MLRQVWTIVALVVTTTCAAATLARNQPQPMVTAAPRLVELRKRYIYYVYYHVDFPETTTCGVVPYALGKYYYITKYISSRFSSFTERALRHRHCRCSRRHTISCDM